MITEMKRIIKDSEIMKEDDSKWPQKNKDGKQELEIRLGNDHISFEVGGRCSSPAGTCAKICTDSEDWIACRCDGIC